MLVCHCQHTADYFEGVCPLCSAGFFVLFAKGSKQALHTEVSCKCIEGKHIMVSNDNEHVVFIDPTDAVSDSVTTVPSAQEKAAAMEQYQDVIATPPWDPTSFPTPPEGLQVPVNPAGDVTPLVEEQIREQIFQFLAENKDILSRPVVEPAVAPVEQPIVQPEPEPDDIRRASYPTVSGPITVVKEEAPSPRGRARFSEAQIALMSDLEKQQNGIL